MVYTPYHYVLHFTEDDFAWMQHQTRQNQNLRMILSAFDGHTSTKDGIVTVSLPEYMAWDVEGDVEALLLNKAYEPLNLSEESLNSLLTFHQSIV